MVWLLHSQFEFLSRGTERVCHYVGDEDVGYVGARSRQIDTANGTLTIQNMALHCKIE